MTEAPYARNEAGTIAVVAQHHHLYIFTQGGCYIIDDPSNPALRNTPPTVPFSLRDTPAEVRERLGLQPRDHFTDMKLVRLSALFNEVLATYIATEELREQFRQKWEAL